jgi:signal transduction histidine kinase
VSEREGDPSNPAWELAAGYADRLQTIVQETVALLGDAGAHASYELSGRELASTIRDRYAATASEKGVLFEVNPGFSSTLDSHRGSLLCLIANNLVQNAVAATAAGRRVTVSLIDNGGVALLSVADEGSGISAAAQEDLFKPGRSSRPGGSGLGLAISQLLARQIGAELSLQSTGPLGTTFVVTLHFRG